MPFEIPRRAPINVRILRLAFGNLEHAKAVGEGISASRIDHGPGYRVYFARRGPLVVLLLCGGDKGTPRSDIERARNQALEFEG